MIGFVDFERVCELETYRPKGMFHAEVYFFLQACERNHCHAVIESGVKYGMSTRLLGATFIGPVLSVDLQPMVRSVPGADIIQGDSMILVPRLVDRYAPSGVAVLIDGPKGRRALDLKDACFAAGARVVGVHDQRPGQGELQHTHSAPVYREIAAVLDRFVSSEYRTKYPSGPGLAIWEHA